MIAVDATPLAAGPRRGVARALLTLLRGLYEIDAAVPVRLYAPRALPPDVPLLDGHVVPPRPVRSAARFRRMLPRLLKEDGATVFLSPWSAVPRTTVPRVATVHELPFVRAGPVEGRLRAWRHRVWLRRDVRECEAIVVPSQATRADLLRLHPQASDRVRVVPHGFDPGPWTEAARSRDWSGRPYAVLVGTGGGGGGSGKKGVDVALAALRALDRPDLDLFVVGELTGRHPSSVRTVREPDDATLAALVAGAALLVHPARSEGFGYPPLEAMAAGVPVVASRAGAIPEVVGDAALLVPPGDPRALADAVRRLLDEPGLRERLVAAGRRRARAFPAPAAARRMLEILREARRRW